MRQVFSSPRIENVEAVARMLEEAGIEVRISNGRSYRGAIRGNFSYRDRGSSGPSPSIWVIRSEQQPEARRLLREAGLLKQLPVRGESYLPATSLASAGERTPAARRGRYRYALLAGVAVVVALVMLAYRAGPGDGDVEPPAAPVAGTPAAPSAAVTMGPVPEVATLPDTAFIVATPPALATTVLRAELAAAGTALACLGIDGGDPDPALLAMLADSGLDVVAASSCGGNRTAVEVADYRTDGSGRGHVRITVDGGEARELAVRREGRTWRLHADD